MATSAITTQRIFDADFEGQLESLASILGTEVADTLGPHATGLAPLQQQVDSMEFTCDIAVESRRRQAFELKVTPLNLSYQAQRQTSATDHSTISIVVERTAPKK